MIGCKFIKSIRKSKELLTVDLLWVKGNSFFRLELNTWNYWSQSNVDKKGRTFQYENLSRNQLVKTTILLML